MNSAILYLLIFLTGFTAGACFFSFLSRPCAMEEEPPECKKKDFVERKIIAAASTHNEQHH